MNLKDTILHESLKLFSLNGFLSTSIQDILSAANTSKGGFYNLGTYVEGSDKLEESEWQFGDDKYKRTDYENNLFGEWNPIVPVQSREVGFSTQEGRQSYSLSSSSSWIAFRAASWARESGSNSRMAL